MENEEWEELRRLRLAESQRSRWFALNRGRGGLQSASEGVLLIPHFALFIFFCLVTGNTTSVVYPHG